MVVQGFQICTIFQMRIIIKKIWYHGIIFTGFKLVKGAFTWHWQMILEVQQISAIVVHLGNDLVELQHTSWSSYSVTQNWYTKHRYCNVCMISQVITPWRKLLYLHHSWPFTFWPLVEAPYTENYHTYRNLIPISQNIILCKIWILYMYSSSKIWHHHHQGDDFIIFRGGQFVEWSITGLKLPATCILQLYLLACQVMM